MKSRTALYTLTCSTYLAVAGLLTYTGDLPHAIATDTSRLTALILGGFVIGAAAVPRSPRLASWIGDKLVLLGLIGTVLGFIMAMTAIDPNAAGSAADIAGIVKALVAGMGTALYTTLAGAVGWLGIEVLKQIWTMEE